MSRTVTALAHAATTASAVAAPQHQHQLSTSLEAKVVVLGSQNVGKTSLVHRYVHSSFLPSNMTPSTVGASFITTRVHDPETDTTMRLQIWDTAGQERFRSISKLYYRGAHAAVLCYDITSKKSFEDMGVWLRELKEKGTTTEDQTILHIVGTKSDIVAEDPSKREVPFERCIDFVAQELFAAAPPVPTNHQAATAANTRPGSSHLKSTTPLPAAPNMLQANAALAPHSNRSSLVWGAPDQVWDCCHEISAKDGEGIDEVFRVITRKLIEQQHAKLERQRALDANMGRTPAYGMTPGVMSRASNGGAGYFDYRHGHGGANYLTPNPAMTGGSFRLGHGDKRRSWLSIGPSSMGTTPGFPGLSVEEEERLKMLEGRRGRCC